MTPRDALTEILGAGKSQPEIVRLLAENGTKTTQATISRIASGVRKTPNYDLGAAIVSLHQKLKSEAAA